MILGSTGSIGTQAIDLVLRNPDRFRVTGALRRRRPGRPARRAGPPAAGADRRGRPTRTSSPPLREALAGLYGAGEPLPEILAGPGRRHRGSPRPTATPCSTASPAPSASRPTLAALEAGRTLALANKESLIVGGPLVKALAKPGQIIPVDSEHAALFQALAAGTRAGCAQAGRHRVRRPLPRPYARRELATSPVEDALAHPTWAMGPVITINSATLVNKGLEVIEAHLLYDIPFDRIEVVVHPQSYVHSMVEFTDGSTLAQATPARHAGADRPRPRLARARPGRRARLRLDARRPPGSSSRSTTTPSPRWPRPARG